MEPWGQLGCGPGVECRKIEHTYENSSYLVLCAGFMCGTPSNLRPKPGPGSIWRASVKYLFRLLGSASGHELGLRAGQGAEPPVDRRWHRRCDGRANSKANWTLHSGECADGAREENGPAATEVSAHSADRIPEVCCRHNWAVSSYLWGESFSECSIHIFSRRHGASHAGIRDWAR